MRRSLAALALVLSAAAPALADGFIIVEPEPSPRPRTVPVREYFPLEVEHHRVTVTIDGQVATTSVDQSFHNPTGRRMEGTYIFPLPEDAAVTEFSLWIDGVETPGEVLDRQEALDIYTGIVRRMEDPALLEYMGRGLFKVRIFPIEPHSSRRIRLAYRQVVPADAGRVRYVYPLNTEKFSSVPLQDASVSVSITSDVEIKGIYSPWHDVDVQRTGEHAARASWEATNVRPTRDFVLDYDLAEGDIGMSLRTHAVPAEDGSFLIIISPKVEVSAEDRLPKDVVFVIDTSGTMAADDKMAQARNALNYCIASLNPEDRFAVVDFATTARTYRDELVPAMAELKAGAQHYVSQLEARGGTAIDGALKRSLAFADGRDGRPFTVVFLTDGRPTIGETEPDRILENLTAATEGVDARLFVWGVGGDLNAHLLDRMALDHGGATNYVLPGEDIEVAMSTFYDKISSPVLTDLQLEFTNVRVHDMFPQRLPDLFAGSQLVVTGRFTGEGHGAVRLRGKVNGEPRELVYEGDFARSDDNPHVLRLWARRNIAYLLDQIRLHGETEELRSEVVRLARRFGLPTPYTSYLVVEEGQQGMTRGDGPMAPGDDAAGEAFDELRRAAAEPSPSRPEAGGAWSGERDGRGQNSAEGEEAVRQAELAGRLRDGSRADMDDVLGLDREVIERTMRTVGDSTFYRQGERWVQSTLPSREDAEEWREVEYLSEAYFELVSAHPELGVYLALGKVLFLHDGVVYEVK
jgi:Ca-activated chloride channel homolog